MNQILTLNITLVLASIALVLSIVSLYLSRKNTNFKKLFGQSTEPTTAAEMIDSITDVLAELKQQQINTNKTLEQLSSTLLTAFQHSSVIRFNSTGSDGGNLSFSLALLNGEQSGFIITSLHGRDHNRTYCKAVIRGESLQQLSEEERQAFMEAMTGPSNLATATPNSKKVKR